MVGWVVRVCLPGEDDIEVPFENDEGLALGRFLAETTLSLPYVTLFVNDVQLL